MPPNGYRRNGDLSIEVFEEGPASARLALDGELDLATCSLLDEQIRGLEARDLHLLVIDLRELRFIDSTGIECFVRLAQRIRESETTIRFLHGPEPVEQLFQIVGLAEILPFETNGSPAGTAKPPESP